MLAHRADALPLRLRVPDVPQQLLLGEDLARRRAQEREQVELAAAQLDVVVAHRHLAGGEIQLELAERQLDVPTRRA